MTNKSTRVLSEISPGELLDKISILEIKLEKVKDKDSQKKIRNEYDILKKTQNAQKKQIPKWKHTQIPKCQHARMTTMSGMPNMSKRKEMQN